MAQPTTIAAMNRRSCLRTLRWVLMIAFTMAFTFDHVAYAADQATNQTLGVVQQVQSFYDQVKNVGSDFTQTYYYQLYKKTQRSTGKVVFSKPGKMRWDYAAPNNKKIVSDGKTLIIYEPGEGKQPGQMIEQSLKNAELPQALTFLVGTGKLANIFRPKLLDAKKYGFTDGYVLELTPLKAQAQYAKVLFYVDRSAERRGVVHRVIIIDAQGNRNRFDFSNMQFNRPVSGALFSWRPPVGTQKIGAQP